MVSFSCEVCSDILKKPKLDSHALRCRGAYYTCIDCSKTFKEGAWKGHTSCISEAEKYQGNLYKPEKGKGKGAKGVNGNGNGKENAPAKKVEAAEEEGQKRKEKKDGKKKRESAGGAVVETPAVTTEVTAEVEEDTMTDAPPTPVAETTEEEPKSVKKDKKKPKKEKKDNKKPKGKETPAAPETIPESAVVDSASVSAPAPAATEAADDNSSKKKRKSVSAEDTSSKRKAKRGKKKKPDPMTQEKLAELLGEEDMSLEAFLEKVDVAVDGAHDNIERGKAFQGSRVKVEGGKVVLSYHEEVLFMGVRIGR